MIYLDSPPEMLLGRKGEGTFAQMRQDYLGMRILVPRFEAVEGTRPHEVTREVAGHIEAFAQAADTRVNS